MRVAVVHQHGDDIHRNQDTYALKKPQRSTLKSADNNFHSDVTAKPLAIRNCKKGKNDHGKLDEVDIPSNWKIKDLSANDLYHA